MAGTDGFGITLTGGTSGAIGSIITIEIPGVSRGEIDVTTHSSAAGWAEKIPPGVHGVPDITFTCLFIKAAETVLRAAAINGTPETWTIADGAGGTSSWACSGFIKEIGHDAVPVDDCIRMSVTIGWTANPTFVAG